MRLKPLAEALGVSRSTFYSYIKNGFLEKGKDAKYNTQKAINHYNSIDPAVRARGDAVRIKAGKAPMIDVAPGEDPDSPTEIELTSTTSLVEAKRFKEIAAARKAQIAVDQAMGELIDRETVEAAVGSLGSTIQMQVINLAPKLRPHMSDHGKDILERELKAILTEVVRSLEKLTKPESE